MATSSDSFPSPQQILERFTQAHAKYGMLPLELIWHITDEKQDCSLIEFPSNLFIPSHNDDDGKMTVRRSHQITSRCHGVRILGIDACNITFKDEVKGFNCVLRVTGDNFEIANDAAQEIRECGAIAGAIVSSRGLFKVNCADSPLAIWLATIIAKVGNSPWFSTNDANPIETVYSHPFSIMVETWRLTIDDLDRCISDPVPHTKLELAKYLNVTDRSIRRWIKSGKLKTQKKDGILYFSQSQLEMLSKSRT